MKIMIVDDDIMIVKGMINIIGKFELGNCELATAYNAIDALDMLQYGGADLLISDIDMPAMNGLDLIKEAKDRHYCEHFIILTGYDKFEFVRQALRYHVSDYLLKPIDKRELHEAILRMRREIKNEEPAELAEHLAGLAIYRIQINRENTPEKLLHILDYMNTHFTTTLSLDQLGAHFHVHPNYICSLFKDTLHMTFLYYLDCIRLQKSVTLLLYGDDMTIEKIALASGFMNERHFYKVFKKRIGQTPGVFREENRMK